MNFPNDRFSAPGPEWVSLTAGERDCLCDLIGVLEACYSKFFGEIVTVSKVSGLEVNSSNLQIAGSKGSVVVKLLASGDITSYSSQVSVYKQIEKLDLPAPKILGKHSDNVSGQPFLVMEYIQGQYFSGSQLDLSLTGSAIKRLHQGLSGKSAINIPELELIQDNSYDILNRFLATHDQWDLKFGPELAFVLRQHIDVVVQTEAICSNSITALLKEKRSVLHMDLHPHNIIVGSGRATIIDVDSLRIAAWPSALGFGFYKIARQTIAKNPIGTNNLAGLRGFFSVISFDFSSKNNTVELCYLGALTEILRRVIIIFEGNLDGQVSPWNQVLEIQLRALTEVPFVFNKYLR